MKKIDVMSVNVKDQAQLTKSWGERAGLKEGGAVRVVELHDPEHSLLLTPIQHPRVDAKGLANWLRQCPGELPVPERHVLLFK